MELKKSAMAGTLESSDIQVTIEPGNGEGVTITLKSSVEKQFGKQIRSVIMETLSDLGVQSAAVTAVDKGALDCTIKARVQAAAYRSADQQTNFKWEA